MRQCSLALLAAAAAACGGTVEAGPRVAARDSAGIELVESTPPPRERTRPWVIDSLPLVDIGADPDDPKQEFTYPSPPIRLPDGRIAVAEPDAQEIRFFDAEGRWLASVGGKGGGPGEFAGLSSIHLGPGDSIYAHESGNGLVSVLDEDGRFGRRVRPDPPGEGRFAIFTGVFADGAWLVDGSAVTRPVRAGVFRATMTLFEYSADGKVVDSLGSVPGWEAFGQPVGADAWRFYSLPFARAAVVALAGMRAVLTPTERVDLRIYRRGGGLERIARIALPRVSLTRGMIERAAARRVDAATRMSNEQREEYRRTLLGATYPDVVPAISRIAIAEDGDIWLEQPGPDDAAPARYVIADSTGRWRAFADGPARFVVSWIGADRVLGVWRDEDDVAHVRTYRLIR